MFFRLFFRKKQQVFIEHLLYSPGMPLPTGRKDNNSWCSFPPGPSPLTAADLPEYTLPLQRPCKRVKNKGKNSLLKWHHHIIRKSWYRMLVVGATATSRAKILCLLASWSLSCLQPPSEECLYRTLLSQSVPCDWAQADRLVPAQDNSLYQAAQDTSMWSKQVCEVTVSGKEGKSTQCPHFLQNHQALPSTEYLLNKLPTGQPLSAHSFQSNRREIQACKW